MKPHDEPDDEPRRCPLCRHTLDATELATCVLCTGRVRRALLDVVTQLPELSIEMIAHAGTATPPDLAGVRGHNDQIPGGDAMVMLARGGARWLGDQGDVDAVVDMLARYEDDWRAHFGAGPSRRVATLTGAARYLLGHLAAAAQHHPAFTDFARDVHVHAAAIRRYIGHADPTERGAPCPYCGARIVRYYTDPRCCEPIDLDTLGYDHDLAYAPRNGRTRPCRHDDPRRDHDQGGRWDSWICSNRDCGRTYSDDQHNLAIWEAWRATG